MSTEKTDNRLKYYTQLAEEARTVSGVVNAYKVLEKSAEALDELVREVYELQDALDTLVQEDLKRRGQFPPL